MAVQPWRKAEVIRIEEETHNTRRFWLRISELESFDFIPGQFVTLDLPIHEKPGKRIRSYSIASWPDGSNVIELLIVLLEKGAGSTYLFTQVQPGSELVLRGPQGVFTLPEPLDKDVYLICTGTGIAPFRSMVYHIRNHALPHRNIYLIFGTRTQKDLLYPAEMTQLQQDLPLFRYIPTLSREQWDGSTGYVHGVYERLIRENSGGNILPDALFYLCGWKDMIEEAKRRILEMGFSKKAIHQELYG